MAYDTPSRTRNAVTQIPRVIDLRKRLVGQYAGGNRYTQSQTAKNSALKGLRTALGARAK